MTSMTLTVLSVVLFAAVASARTLVDSDGVRGPPPIGQNALMARYIVNEAEWTSVATVSVRENAKNYPFVNLLSTSDGEKGKGSGVPYVFITPLDFTGQDLEKDDRATMLMSLAQGSWCVEKGYDPMDPRCARVIFSGRIKKVSESDPDYGVAKNAIYGRHGWLAHMPPNHHFYFAKLEIETISLLDTFGGIKNVEVDDYYNADQSAVDEYALRYR